MRRGHYPIYSRGEEGSVKALIQNNYFGKLIISLESYVKNNYLKKYNYAERSEVWLGRLSWKWDQKFTIDISKYTELTDCFQNLRGYQSWVKDVPYTFWWWSDHSRFFYNFFNAYRLKFKFSRFKPNFYVF